MADFGLNEPSNIIGEVLPLLYFSQAFEQTRLREDQNRLENQRAQEAMALRQREEARQAEAFTLERANVFSKFAPLLPDAEREEGTNEFIRKPFGLAPVTGPDVDRDLKRVSEFQGLLQTEQDPQKQAEAYRNLRRDLRSQRGLEEAAVFGEQIGKEPAVAVLTGDTGVTAEPSALETERNYLRTLPKDKLFDLYKQTKTSDTIQKAQAVRRVIELRSRIHTGHASPEEINEETTLSGAFGIKEDNPLAQAHTQAMGRNLTAQNFQKGFASELERMDRGLVPLQQAQERGSLKALDALDQAISSKESRGLDDLTLTETYDLQRLKDQRTAVQKTVFDSLGLNSEQRETSVMQMRQRVAQLDRAMLGLKKQKGIPGAESQLHAMEAMSEAYKAQIQALTTPSSAAVSRLSKAKDRMAKELDFWGQEQQKAEKDIARLTKARLKSGTDQQLRQQAEKEAAAQAQREFAALPKPEQTSQKAAQITAKVEDETGVAVPVDDVLKAGKDLNAPLLKIEQKEETSESQVVGKGFGEQYVETQKAGAEALGKIARLERMEGLLQGVETGKLTPAMTEIAAVGQALGIEVDKNLPAKQALQALSNEVALQLRNPSGGAGMPGALSDKDREFLLKMTPGLANTPEGNRLIIQTGKALAKRDQEVALMARQYRKKNGHLDEGFYDELADYSAKHPLFKDKAVPKAEAGGYVEIRTTKDGRRLGKKADGTIEVVQ